MPLGGWLTLGDTRVPRAGAICTALLLGGCSAPAAGLAVFQRDALAGDQLPAATAITENPRLENTRLLVEADAVRYYAAQGENRTLTCGGR